MPAYIKYPQIKPVEDPGILWSLNEKEIWTRIRKTALNPFQNVNIKDKQSIRERFQRTYEVFAGDNYKTMQDFDSSEEEKIPIWKVPPQVKLGLFSLLSLPIQAVYLVIPVVFILSATLSAAIVEKLRVGLTKVNGPFAKGLGSLLASPFFIAGAGLFIGGFLGYSASKLALYPVNWIAQRVVVPALSLLAVAVVSSVVGLVQLVVSRSAKPKNASTPSSTPAASTTAALTTEMASLPTNGQQAEQAPYKQPDSEESSIPPQQPQSSQSQPSQSPRLG